MTDALRPEPAVIAYREYVTRAMGGGMNKKDRRRI